MRASPEPARRHPMFETHLIAFLTGLVAGLLIAVTALAGRIYTPVAPVVIAPRGDMGCGGLMAILLISAIAMGLVALAMF